MNIFTNSHIQEKLHEGAYAVIYRAYCKENQQTVVLKALHHIHLLPRKIARFKREYEIIQKLRHIDGVIRSYGLEEKNHTLAILLEDFGGKTLEQCWDAEKFELAKFLSLAIRITDILGNIHQQNVIHKDINPSNILWNPETDELRIIDFGIATTLSREKPAMLPIDILEGSPSYLSPEQTGRMNRLLDYRTDFYSLGVTFYQLLTGQLPFQSNDIMELLHEHITKKAKPPHEHNKKIPGVLSDIVMKLMAKTVEGRYQSATALKFDLQKCLNYWNTMGEIPFFNIAQNNVSEKFQVSQQLYGRDDQRATLLTAFDKVANGAIEMLLVAGYSGIGKSALVYEVHKPILQKQGYFISGKFDQFQQNIPYAPFIQAFQELVQQLLTESEVQIERWKQQLLAALGPNGQVIIEVIPEVELIIGKQPSVPDLPPTESQNRFNWVFQDFMQVFSNAARPLVIFLDDLQWVDLPSLKLIEVFLTGLHAKYMLLVGAYRDNEVTATHPLMLSLDKLRKENRSIHTIVLKPLGLEDVNHLIADTLRCDREQSGALSELCFQKTGGNPFFLNQFLQTLYQEKNIVFEGNRGTWQWDMAEIRRKDMTDNVVELMTRKIQKLSNETQHILKLAACIGNRFDLNTLIIVHQKSSTVTAKALWEAVQEGLILSIKDKDEIFIAENDRIENPDLSNFIANYKFLHDRVQQAAYSLMEDEQKKALHLKIGRLMLKNIPKDEREEWLFDIVNQLNKGIELIHDQLERDELAALNLLAGKKAKISTAYGPAYNYLKIGLNLLARNSWNLKYDLTLSLHTETIDIAYIGANFEEMQELVKVVFERAATLLDKLKIYEIQIQACISQTQLLEAIKIALSILKLLGIHFPEKPNKLNILLALASTKIALFGKPINSLCHLQEMKYPYKVAAMRILTKVAPPIYMAVPKLLPLVISKQINLSVKYGNTAESAYAFSSYGVILCGILNDVELGYKFGQLALQLEKKIDDKKIKVKVLYNVHCLINYWKKHAREALPGIQEAYRIGMEIGDLEFVAYLVDAYFTHSYFIGKDLIELEQEMVKYISVIKQLKHKTVSHFFEIYRQVVLNLIGQSEKPYCLMGESYNEEKMLPILQESDSKSSLCRFYGIQIMLNYLFQRYDQAVESSKMLKIYLDAGIGTISFIYFFFYGSLSWLAVFPEYRRSEKKRILKIISNNLKKLKKWADHAPMNFLHKYYLVEAERNRVLGHDAKAREFYDKAISLAQEHQYINEEALACELAGRFYLSKEQKHIAQHYLKDAYSAYQQWGALAKIKDLEKRYPEFFAQPKTTSSGSLLVSSLIATGQRASSTLDLSSVIKASQAISSEIILEKLLEKLMKIVIENAGAEKSYLILEKEDKSVIAASGYVDQEKITILQSLDALNSQLLSQGVINYVRRIQKSIVLENASDDNQFANDPYIISQQPKSVLCTPILKQGKLMGMLYLENNTISGAFTSDRLAILKLLSLQIAISLENAKLYDVMKLEIHERREAEEQLRSLSLRLQTIREEERKHIAREVHDELGGALTALQMDLYNLENLLPKTLPAKSFQKINTMAKLIDTTTQSIQRIATDLRPGVLDNLGLSAAIEWQARVFQRRSNISFQLNLDKDNVVLDADRSTTLFRIFQEALTNVFRHAQATKVIVCLKEKNGNIIMDIKDNGKGIDHEEVFHIKSLGLLGMRERMNPWKGEVKITGMKNKGTKVEVMMPIN